ncbi:MAG: 23S rRNA (uracil(1939)-C(5))-methyltransferase RlmD [Ruminococcaceae bacterium]|nr:23S rRNA (uracil(1939)-C(5))-methyltransferase RlmD [Oscillospiraceae bacterium]
MLKKNDIISLRIENLSSDGNGVGHHEGFAVFVPFSTVGDLLSVRIAKLQKSYAFGIAERVLEPSADRIPVDCPHFKQCGGCTFRHISYDAEKQAKRVFVKDALLRLGGIDINVEETLSSPNPDRYRNKVQFPVASGKNGLYAGLFSPRSHRVIPISDCLLQPAILNKIASRTCALLSSLGVTAYNEETGKGTLRHILLRQSDKTGEVMLCLVINADTLPCTEEFLKIRDEFPQISTIVLNINRSNTNVILGRDCRTLWGEGVLHDELCSVPVRLSPLSFLQVNSLGARTLYEKVREVADIHKDDTVLDLYCGTGTIGLSLASGCKKLIGVEVVGQAVDDARKNAEAMGYTHCEFICADAGAATAELLKRGEKIDLAITDPPRKGCGDELLSCLIEMDPTRIVMVSCNPATLARDLKYLFAHGYADDTAYPVDMFPRTPHVETCVLLSHKNPQTSPPS